MYATSCTGVNQASCGV